MSSSSSTMDPVAVEPGRLEPGRLEPGHLEPGPGTHLLRVRWDDLDELERWAPTAVRRARAGRTEHGL